MSETIVVVAPNWLGDAVMALPAVGAVRRHHPAARLVVAARSPVADLFRMAPGLDDVVELKARGGRPGAAAWRDEAETLARTRADLVVLLPNSFRSAWVARRAGIRERWGYAADWRRPLLTRPIRRPRRLLHVADYYLALAAALGMPSPDRTAAIVVPDAQKARAAAALERSGVGPDATLVGMAPGAAYGGAKQWPPERFGRVARLLHERRGVVSVLVGSAGDRAAGGRIDGGPGLVDLIGRTDLPMAAGLMTRFRAFLTNDSGAMHLAAAAGVPVTAIFGPTRERETAPLASASPSAAPHAILTGDAWCRPCMLRECPFDHRCMTGIEPGRVVAAVERQLDHQPAGVSV
jgi:heptosyltransferase-2